MNIYEEIEIADARCSEIFELWDEFYRSLNDIERECLDLNMDARGIIDAYTNAFCTRLGLVEKLSDITGRYNAYE